MNWDRDIAAIFITIVMLTSLILVSLKRKEIGKNIGTLILILSVLISIEIFGIIKRNFNEDYNTTILYVIGVNLVVFSLYFLYFHQILKSKEAKRINIVLFVLFLINYMYSASFNDTFFTKFSFFSYFIGVVLISGSIYLVLSQTFNSDRILSLGGYLPLWVCISFLINYLGVLPLLIISFNASMKMNLNVFFATLFLVNFAGSATLLYGIIKAKKES